MSLIIYKSSAGSGKTYTLVFEYIKLLIANPKEYRHILAITFTNKATEEMKSRIISALSRLSVGDFDDLANELLIQLSHLRVTHEKIRQNAHRALSNILHNYSEFSISTIDSFFQKILRNFAKELKLPLRYEVEMDNNYVIEQVVAHLMLDIGRRKKFTQFLEQFTLQQMEDNEGWYIENNINELGKEIFKEKIWEHLSRRQKSALSDAEHQHEFVLENPNPQPDSTLVLAPDNDDDDEYHDYNEENNKPETEAEAENKDAVAANPELLPENEKETDPMAMQYAQLEILINDLWEVKKEFKQKIKDFVCEAEEFISQYQLSPDNFKAGSFSWFKNILTDKFDMGAGQRKMRDGDPNAWTTQKSPQKGRIIECVNNGLQDIFMESVRFIEQNKALYMSAKLVLDNIYSLGIMGDIKNKLRDYRTNNNTMMISDTSNILRAIISENDAPFIFEKVGTTYNHVLIDEFQDTSDFQWLNLLPLVKNVLGSDNTALIVGDVKQSIYRWRGGNLELLLNGIKNDLAYFFDANTERDLNRNFRSKETIVQFNNAFFTAAIDVLEHQLTASPFADKLRPAYQDVKQETKRRGDGYVEVRFIGKNDRKNNNSSGDDNDDDNDNNNNNNNNNNNEGNNNDGPDNKGKGWKSTAQRWLLNLVKDLLAQGVPLRDIAILVRTNNAGSELAKFLSEQGYKVISSEALLLNNSRKVQLLISALQYLADHRNKIARTELLVNYCYFYPPNLDSLTYHDLCSDHLYRSDPEWVSLFDRLLPQAFTQHLFDLVAHPLYEIAETLVQIFGFCQQTDAYIQRFLDLILEKQTGKNLDLRQFLDWWSSHSEDSNATSVVVPKGEDAITIISIHKAKGLEFPIVIIPYADWETTPSARGLMWAETKVPPFDQLGLVPVKINKKLESTIFAQSYDHEKMLCIMDNLNLLYVALTRPTERLYIFAPLPTKMDNNINSISKIIYSVLCGFEFSESFDLLNNVFTLGDANVPHHSKENANETSLLNRFLSNNYQEKLTIRTEATRFFMLFDNAQTEAVRTGQKVHSVLEKIKHPDELDKVLRQLSVKGLIDDSEIDLLRHRVEKIFAMPEVNKWFITSSYDEVLCERTLMRDLNRRIPDRVMIKDKRATIVDYKTGEKNPKHEKQINHYAQILQKMGYGIESKYLLYIGENDAQVIQVT